MNTTPLQSKMDERQEKVEAALTKWGFESLWANGKGGGFWVKGHGYQTLEECAQLINRAMHDFVVSEKDRLGELMLKAMEKSKKANTAYFEKAMTVYQQANEMLEALNKLPFPTFWLPPPADKPKSVLFPNVKPAEPDPEPEPAPVSTVHDTGAYADELYGFIGDLAEQIRQATEVTEFPITLLGQVVENLLNGRDKILNAYLKGKPAPAPASGLDAMRERLAALRQWQRDAGDRRDWEATTGYEDAADALEAEIKRIEEAQTPDHK